MNQLLWQRLRHSRSGMTGLFLVAALVLLSLLSATGLLGSNWSQTGPLSWAGSSAAHWFGTNRLGQDIFARALQGTGTALTIGGVVALASTALGALLGAAAGWRPGGLLDGIVLWLAGVLDSVPFYLFAAALAFALGGSMSAMYAAMIATFWTATARLIRAEVMRIRGQDYVLSATALGLPDWLVIGRHVLPNTGHILLVQATLSLVAAIKTEVILSFLGIGQPTGVSWGLMLAEATQDVLAGHFGNFLAASGLLFLTLLGFNLLADALQSSQHVRELPA